MLWQACRGMQLNKLQRHGMHLKRRVHTLQHTTTHCNTHTYISTVDINDIMKCMSLCVLRCVAVCCAVCTFWCCVCVAVCYVYLQLVSMTLRHMWWYAIFVWSKLAENSEFCCCLNQHVPHAIYRKSAVHVDYFFCEGTPWCARHLACFFYELHNDLRWTGV